MTEPGGESGVRLSSATVEESMWLTEDTFRISVRPPDPFGRISPGRFFMIKGWEGNQPLLRRPFSISDMEGDILSFVIKVTGRGTRLIADLAKGDRLSLLGPLGNGFEPRMEVKAHILVAGGVGIAPFPLLQRALRAEDPSCKIDLLYGERDAGRLIDPRRLGFCGGRVAVATEDGSLGYKGTVTELLSESLATMGGSKAVYACGPNAMLKAIRDLVAADPLPLQFSMESVMGCGMGSCMGCVIRVSKNGKACYSRVCHTGPVFEGREVVF